MEEKWTIRSEWRWQCRNIEKENIFRSNNITGPRIREQVRKANRILEATLGTGERRIRLDCEKNFKIFDS